MGRVPSPYATVLTEAVNDLVDNGFDSAERVEYWQERLRRAAEESLATLDEMERSMRDALKTVYNRLVERGGLAKLHPGIARFTVERLTPLLRGELDRRILAATGLIRLNREEAVRKTLHRFSGWATSLPKGKVAEPDKRDTKTLIRKSLSGLPFEVRRLHIDQGHKLTSSINSVLAENGGAIAGVWQSHWRQANYDYRETHKERDEQIYLIRDSWAHKAGLVKPGPAGYTDDVTQPAEEPFCRCRYKFLYALRALPADMVTGRGVQALEAVRENS